MSDQSLPEAIEARAAEPWKIALGRWCESELVQKVVVAVILVNAVLLGMETDARLMASQGPLIQFLDRSCLVFFVIEIGLRITAFGWGFWRSGWNIFDAVVVGIALVPGSGPLAVLRSLRVLRVLRLLTGVPQLRRVVAAFLHSIPGLLGVVAVMAIFFYTGAVLATTWFGGTHPQWFGSIGASLYTLFQIMTLESWSMGIVRPVMEMHPLAWMFFVPFIMVATFTILNLFIGIIVSTMQELSQLPESALVAEPAVPVPADDARVLLENLERDIKLLREAVERANPR